MWAACGIRRSFRQLSITWCPRRTRDSRIGKVPRRACCGRVAGEAGDNGVGVLWSNRMSIKGGSRNRGCGATCYKFQILDYLLLRDVKTLRDLVDCGSSLKVLKDGGNRHMGVLEHHRSLYKAGNDNGLVPLRRDKGEKDQ
jgi:hypothetical protein